MAQGLTFPAPCGLLVGKKIELIGMGTRRSSEGIQIRKVFRQLAMGSVRRIEARSG